MIVFDDVLRFTEVEEPAGIDSKIRQAVRDEVTEKGLKRTTSASVAERAGISRVTLYRRAGKTESLIFHCLITEMHHILVSCIQSNMNAISAKSTGRMFIVNVIVDSVRELRNDPLFAELLQTDPTFVLPYLTTPFGSDEMSIHDELTVLLQECARDGSIDFDASKPERTATVLMILGAQFIISHAFILHLGIADWDLPELHTVLDRYLTPPA